MTDGKGGDARFRRTAGRLVINVRGDYIRERIGRPLRIVNRERARARAAHRNDTTEWPKSADGLALDSRYVSSANLDEASRDSSGVCVVAPNYAVARGMSVGEL